MWCTDGGGADIRRTDEHGTRMGLETATMQGGLQRGHGHFFPYPLKAAAHASRYVDGKGDVEFLSHGGQRGLLGVMNRQEHQVVFVAGGDAGHRGLNGEAWFWHDGS